MFLCFSALGSWFLVLGCLLFPWLPQKLIVPRVVVHLPQHISFIYGEKFLLKLLSGTLSNGGAGSPALGWNRRRRCTSSIPFWAADCLQLLLAFVVCIRIIVEATTPRLADNDSPRKDSVRGGGLRTHAFDLRGLCPGSY